MTRERISFTFDPRDMLLSLQIGFSLVRAAVASAIFDRTPGLEPSSETDNCCKMLEACHSAQLLPFYLYLSLDTIRAVCHQFGLLGTDLHLIFVQVLSRLSIRTLSSCSSSSRATMSSANRRFVIFLPSMLTFPPCSLRALDMIRSRKMLKRVGDRRHPCLTPTVVRNPSAMLPFM